MAWVAGRSRPLGLVEGANGTPEIGTNVSRRDRVWAVRLNSDEVSCYMVFLVMGNDGMTEPSISQAVARIGTLLPGDWAVSGASDVGPLDGQITIVAPGGESVPFDVQLRRWTTAPTAYLRGMLSERVQKASRPLLLVTDYLNMPMRQVCEDLGVSYVDSMGWVWLQSTDPPILLRADGERRRAPRVANEVTRLNGLAAGRVIRTLLTIDPPFGVRELAALSGVASPGSVSKILPSLVAADAVDRDPEGGVIDVRRLRLLERWTQDYSFLRSNSIVLDYLAPRGVSHVIDQLKDMVGLRATGSAAARTYLQPGRVPVTPTTRLTLYVDDIQRVAAALELRRQDRSQANVLLTIPKDKTLLDTPSGNNSVPVVELPQVLADLMTLPGRESSLADQLIEQLSANDRRWAS